MFPVFDGTTVTEYCQYKESIIFLFNKNTIKPKYKWHKCLKIVKCQISMELYLIFGLLSVWVDSNKIIFICLYLSCISVSINVYSNCNKNRRSEKNKYTAKHDNINWSCSYCCLTFLKWKCTEANLIFVFFPHHRRSQKRLLKCHHIIIAINSYFSISRWFL